MKYFPTVFSVKGWHFRAMATLTMSCNSVTAFFATFRIFKIYSRFRSVGLLVELLNVPKHATHCGLAVTMLVRK